MNRLLLIAAAALLIAPAALAKGPVEAQLTGPGLDDDGLTLSGLGDGSGIVQLSGFFPAAFGQSPDPMTQTRPEGPLGPKYTLSYAVPGPSGSDATIVQDVYPYAKPYPVTYTAPGQPFFDTQKTRGGWYVQGTTELRDLLVQAGLPATPPGLDDGGRLLWPWLVGAAALLAALGWAAWFVRGRWTSAIRTPSVS